MTSITRLNRRRFVQVTGAVALTTSLAGCGGNDGGAEYLDDEPDYGGWFDDVDAYEGTVDATDSDEVAVAVGAGGGLSYDPPAVAISPGTTVVWEWTGDGGAHDVAAEDGSFTSENVDQEGFTFEHTFDDPGIYEYYCTPHEAVGMKGAIVVQ